MGVWEDSQANEKQRLDHEASAGRDQITLAEGQKQAIREFVASMEKLGVPPSEIPLCYEATPIPGAVIIGWRIPRSETYINRLLLNSPEITPNHTAIRNNRDLIVTPDAKLFWINMKIEGLRFVSEPATFPVELGIHEPDLRVYLSHEVSARMREGYPRRGGPLQNSSVAGSTLSLENPYIRSNTINAAIGGTIYSIVPLGIILLICSLIWDLGVGILVCIPIYALYMWSSIRDARSVALKGKAQGIFF